MLSAAPGDLVIGGNVVNYLLFPIIVGLIVLIVGWVLDHNNKRRIREVSGRVADTKYEITNEHEQPLRNDLDSKFDLVFSKLNKIQITQARHDTLFKKMGRIVIGIRTDVADLTNDQAENMSDIDDLRKELERREPPTPRQDFPSE